MQLQAAALMLAAPAHAEDTGTLQIMKQGLFPTHVWVDGVARGKIKKKKPLALTVPVGPHEVWYAADADGEPRRPVSL